MGSCYKGIRHLLHLDQASVTSDKNQIQVQLEQNQSTNKTQHNGFKQDRVISPKGVQAKLPPINRFRSPKEAFRNENNQDGTVSLTKDTKTSKKNEQFIEEVLQRVGPPKKAFENVNKPSDKSESVKTDKQRKLARGKNKINIEEELQSNQPESKHLENELQKLKEENESLKKENDVLLTRLSAEASAKLTDGNPNIADLSDMNRPTKLAEQYSELYDNEWTDAFDVLITKGMNEEKACRVLLETFCLIYKTCYEKANGEFCNVVDGINAFLGNQEPPPVEVMKHLKDQRKKNSARLTNTKKLKQEFKDEWKTKVLQHKKSVRKNKKMKIYLDKSIKLCWLMVVQDPPLFVDTRIDRRDELYESNKLKAYTRSGICIDYIVWAPLYLHKDGNLLCKGVAQCKDENKDKVKEDKHNSITENVVNSSNVSSIDTLLFITPQEEEVLKEMKAVSNGDSTKSTCSGNADVKKKSLGKKIMQQSGKGETDQTKHIEVTSKNEEDHCDDSNTHNEANNNVGKARTEMTTIAQCKQEVTKL